MIYYSHKKEYDSLFNLIQKSNSIAVISHKNPDGDTVGSGVAMYFALKFLNKDVDLYCHDVPKYKLSKIKGVENYNQKLIKNKKYDLAIAVDSASIDRLGDFQSLFSKARFSAQIDHHISNNFYAKTINIVQESAANCQNIALFFLYLYDVKKINLFNENIVDALYTGLVTDTGSFAYESVSDLTMYVAWRLKRMGANSKKIVSEQMNSIEYNVFRLKQIVINNVKFYENKKIAISILSKKDFEDTKTEISNTDGLIQNILTISNVECAVMLSESSNNSYKVSIRTKTIDAVNIAQKLSNGGGHPRAAGAHIDGLIEEINDKLLNIIKEEIKKDIL